HLWESGDDPIAALDDLRPMIGHFHLKNISARELLDVFAPPNVYAAAGRREGMVPLFDGVYDYRNFFAHIFNEPNLDASLEWFGSDVKQVLTQDCQRILRLKQTVRQETRLAMGALCAHSSTTPSFSAKRSKCRLMVSMTSWSSLSVAASQRL